jgi:hypothetical protein
LGSWNAELLATLAIFPNLEKATVRFLTIENESVREGTGYEDVWDAVKIYMDDVEWGDKGLHPQNSRGKRVPGSIQTLRCLKRGTWKQDLEITTKTYIPGPRR